MNDTATQFLQAGSVRYVSYANGVSPYYYGIAQDRHTVMGLTNNDTAIKLVGSKNYKSYGETNNVDIGLISGNNFAWNQEYQDLNSGLIYLRSWYYDSKTMRFISIDSNLLDNRYSFGNGINNIDPFGHAAWNVINYILNGIAIIAGIAIPFTGGQSGWITASVVAGIVAGATGIAAQGYHDATGNDSNTLNTISKIAGIIGIFEDAVTLYKIYRTLPVIRVSIENGDTIVRRYAGFRRQSFRFSGADIMDELTQQPINFENPRNLAILTHDKSNLLLGEDSYRSIMANNADARSSVGITYNDFQARNFYDMNPIMNPVIVQPPVLPIRRIGPRFPRQPILNNWNIGEMRRQMREIEVML